LFAWAADALPSRTPERGEVPRALLLMQLEFFSDDKYNGNIDLEDLFESQVFANFYLNTFDHFIKHTLKLRYYSRYAVEGAGIKPAPPETVFRISVL
jgi:hypothetical protein